MSSLNETLNEVVSKIDPLADYWNPTPKTKFQYESLQKEIQSTIISVLTNKKLRFKVEFAHEFGSVPSINPFVKSFNITLDGYTYGRSKDVDIKNAILEAFLVTSTEQVKRESLKTTFMYKGSEVNLFHYSEEAKNRSRYVDSSSLNLFLGYGGMGSFLNILLNRFNFRLDEFFCVYYDLKNESGKVYKTFPITIGIDFILQLLGVESSAITPYTPIPNIDVLIRGFFESKFLGKESFYISEDNTYVGPEDYFGCELFKNVVSRILTNENFKAYDYSPEKSLEEIERFQFKKWKALSGDFHEVAKSKSEYTASVLISNKLSDSLILEITNLKDPEEIKDFRKRFEYSVSQKEDYDFFMLSSSEDTIRKRAEACYGSFKT